MRQCVDLGLRNHVDHVRDARLTLLDVELESLVVLLRFLVVLSCAAPLGLSFVVLGNAEVLIDVTLIDLQDDLRILVHLLVRLSDDESVLAFAS